MIVNGININLFIYTPSLLFLNTRPTKIIADIETKNTSIASHHTSMAIPIANDNIKIDELN